MHAKDVASNADYVRQHIELCAMDGNFFHSRSFSLQYISITMGIGMVLLLLLVTVVLRVCARYEPVVSIALISMLRKPVTHIDC